MRNNLGTGCLILVFFFFSIKGVHENIYRFKYYQTLAGLLRQNPEKNFYLKKNQSSNISFPFFQVDLEPEGKVFVVITLTGSFTEGKGVTLACFHSELDSGLCSCHQFQSSADVWILQGPHAVVCLRFLE